MHNINKSSEARTLRIQMNVSHTVINSANDEMEIGAASAASFDNNNPCNIPNGTISNPTLSIENAASNNNCIDNNATQGFSTVFPAGDDNDNSFAVYHHERVLEYQKDYPIRRFSRRWRRQEVQGVCCLVIEIMLLAGLALLSLHALGYMEEIPDSRNLPYSFSGKILREFFSYEETPPATQSISRCFFASPNEELPSSDANSDEEMAVFDEMQASAQDREHSVRNANKRCNFNRSRHAIDWIMKFFSVNFLAVLTTITSSVFILSLSIRRRKGLQVMLLLPPFICFFISIFQQIRITFQYNYVGLVIKEDLGNAMAFSASVHYNRSVTILDETQAYLQCCGMNGPSSWEFLTRFNGSYPGSCCNTTSFNCAGQRYIPKKYTWSAGCYQKEYERVRMFEWWALILLGFKIIAEIGIFCSLSDLTRFHYPPPEAVENSRCEFGDYQIKCRGAAYIRGVTKNGRIVIKLRYLLPWRLVPSRTDVMGGANLAFKTEMNEPKGSVEIVKRANLDTFNQEMIEIDFSKQNRGLYIFTLR